MWSGDALEGLGADLGAGLLGLLGAPVHDLGHLRGVLAGVGDDRQGDRELRVVLADRRDGEAPLGQLEQLLERDADLLLERVAGVLRAWSARSSRKAFSAGSFQSWPNWLWRNASRSAAASLTLRKKTVESGRTCSGGAAAWRDSPQSRQDPPARAIRRGPGEESPASGYASLDTPFQAPRGSPAEGTNSPPPHLGGGVDRAPGSKPGSVAGGDRRACLPLRLAATRVRCRMDRPRRARRVRSGSQGRSGPRAARRRSCRPGRLGDCVRPEAGSAPRAARTHAGAAGRGSGSRCWGWSCRTRTPRGCGGSP